MTGLGWRGESSEISEAPLFIDDSPILMMMEVRAKVRRLKQKRAISRLIHVIDYLQLMTSGRKDQSHQQEVSEFSRRINFLAKETRSPRRWRSVKLDRRPEQRTRYETNG